MKLRIRRMHSPGIPGGSAYVLCDYAGDRLPMQEEVTLVQKVGSPTRITVTFIVDGQDVKIHT